MCVLKWVARAGPVPGNSRRSRFLRGRWQFSAAVSALDQWGGLGSDSKRFRAWRRYRAFRTSARRWASG